MEPSPTEKVLDTPGTRLQETETTLQGWARVERKQGKTRKDKENDWKEKDRRLKEEK